jgi:hypothetical protein
MRRNARRIWLASLAAALLVANAYGAVSAEPPTLGEPAKPRGNLPTESTTFEVVSGETGVTILISIAGVSPGSTGSPGSSDLISGPGGPTCTAQALNVPFNSATNGWMQDGLRDNPGTIPVSVRCDDIPSVTIVWVPIDGGDPPDIVVNVLPSDPVAPSFVAEDLFGIVPLPPISLRANPGTGLVAMPAWFWVEGYDGTPLSGSETLGNTTVEVEIAPQRYDWHFGDGGFLSAGSLGRPYPDESDIQHTYEQSSQAAGGQYEVRLEITFAGQFRVITEEDDGNGNIVVTVGDWEPLDPMVRSFVALYPVQQLQSVLTAGQR